MARCFLDLIDSIWPGANQRQHEHQKVEDSNDIPIRTATILNPLGYIELLFYAPLSIEQILNKDFVSKSAGM